MTQRALNTGGANRWRLVWLTLIATLTACTGSLEGFVDSSGASDPATVTTSETGATSETGETSESTPSTPTTTPGPVDFLVFGDTADCRGRDAEVAAAVAADGSDILFVGDAAYPDGSPNDFATCFLPLYGELISRFHAVPGDNDYRTDEAAEFYRVFGAGAGDPTQGWFSFTTSGWQIIGLNSNCESIGGCDEDSPQYKWLAETLASEPDVCRLAFWQLPRFTSSANYDGIPRLGPMYGLLYDARTDLLFAGNSHHYERFTRLGIDGSPDPTGIRNFTVGTGGVSLTDFADPPREGSEVRNNTSHGFVKLTLSPEEYQWEFVGATAESDLVDSGSSPCLRAEK